MDIRLYQIADSALPTGGFVFSSGMEGASTMGWIDSVDELKQYVMGALHSYSHNELRFARDFYNDLQSMNKISKDKISFYHASLTSLGMRKGSFLQGESWSRIIVRLFPILNSKNGSLAKETKHFLPLYCESLFNLGHTIKDANSLLFYIFVRDQISAAVRLGICGPLEGQVIQAQLLEMQTKVLKTASLPEPPIKTAARWEICQSIHSRVYSTLFQN